jgi:hypothetical protein
LFVSTNVRGYERELVLIKDTVYVKVEFKLVIEIALDDSSTSPVRRLVKRQASKFEFEGFSDTEDDVYHVSQKG